MSFRNLARITVLLLLLPSLSSCAIWHKKQTVSAPITVNVTDPLTRRLTEATRVATIDAQGAFHPGTYVLKGTVIKIAPDTHFKLKLSLPVDDPNVLSTENATGELTTTMPLIVHGVEIPQQIEVGNGRASASVDVLQTIGAYLLNIFEDNSANSDDARKLIEYMDVQDVTLDLRAGSVCKLGPEEVHIAKDSQIKLFDLKVDRNLDYKGKCLLKVAFEKDSKWIGTRVDCDFNGGATTLNLDAQRVKGKVTLSLSDKGQEVNLADCIFRWGRNKGSWAHADHCLMKLDEFSWTKGADAGGPLIHLVTRMDLLNTKIDLKTVTQETVAEFAGDVPASLKLDLTEKGCTSVFATKEHETAKTAHIEIHRPTSNLAISLEDAMVGPFVFDRGGGLNFSFSNGMAKLKQLTWKTGERTFELVTSGPSMLQLPDGMSLSRDVQGGTSKLTLPILVDLGSATINGSAGQIKLTDLKGNLSVNVDKDVRLASNMDLSIANSGLFGSEKADVTARGFKLQTDQGKAQAHIDSCSIQISDAALQKAIEKELPKEKTFSPHKVIDKQKWRYRKVTIDTATANNIKIMQMKHKTVDTVEFKAEADVNVSGTVEKEGIMDAIRHREGDWETRPWKATAHLTGTGTVKYKLQPKDSLAASAISYELDMKLPLPKDIDVDWSKVSHGILHYAEHAVIVNELSKITVPLHFNGVLSLGDVNDSQWKSIKVTKLLSKPADNGIILTFVADAAF